MTSSYPTSSSNFLFLCITPSSTCIKNFVARRLPTRRYLMPLSLFCITKTLYLYVLVYHENVTPVIFLFLRRPLVPVQHVQSYLGDGSVLK
jgi:hypothetical protein